MIMGFSPTAFSNHEELKRKGVVALGLRFEKQMWLTLKGMRNANHDREAREARNMLSLEERMWVKRLRS